MSQRARSKKPSPAWPSWLPLPDDADLDARRPVSVLVVDDDEETRALFTRALAKAGYSVETAGNGSEALRVLRAVRPCVIFLDICMPGMDGAEFRQVQRRDRRLLEIPTVVMTGDRATEPQLDLAVEQTLQKPIKRAELLAIVARHCGPAD